MMASWRTRALIVVLAAGCGCGLAACGGVTDAVDSVIRDAMGMPAPARTSAPANPASPALSAPQTNALTETASSCGPGRAPARPGAGPCAGFGSGIFVSRTGDILTSAHIVEGCVRVAVRGSTGTVYLGRMTAADRAHDLALLHVEGNVPATAPFGLAPPPAAAWIAALGFPEDRSTLSGATPAVGRILPPGTYNAGSGLIPFSAAVMRGNSGGPIVDQSGAVVGVVYAQYDPSPGVFLAVGAAEARRFLDSQSIGYATARAARTRLTADEIIRAATVYTVFVQCLA